MPGYIEDRWWTKRPDPKTGKKRKTALYGNGKRWKVTGIPGVRARSFELSDGPQGAKAWLARAQAESARGEFVDPRDGRILLADYVEQEYLPSLTNDPSTKEHIALTVRKHIVGQLGATPINAVKVPQLRAWLVYLSKTVGPGYANIIWGYLSTILQAAVEDERIPRNYCKSKSVRPPKPPERPARAWSKERVMAVRAELKPRFRILVDIGAGLGLRQGEALGLAVEDFDEAAEVVHVHRQIKVVHGKMVFGLPKGGKVRDVPLPSHLLKRVKAHLAEFPAQKVTLPWGNPDEPTTDKEAEERAARTHALLVTSAAAKPGPIRRDAWNSWHWKPALAAAGVIPPLPEFKDRGRSRVWPPSREYGYHSLRHTFASVQLDARETVVSVSKWLGHANAAITLRVYAHMMPEADGRGRRAMNAWFEDQI